MEPVRFHHLKTIGTKSARHLRDILDGSEAEPTYAMERGTAVHAILFGTRKVVGYLEGKQRRGKEWEAFEAANADAEILTASDYETACRMADSVSRHKDAIALLGGVQEETIMWDLGGRECRATPDARLAGEYLTELKTGATADPQRFTWQAIRMGYHAQLAWYHTAMMAGGEAAPKDCYIVAVESARPYPVTVLRLTPRALEMGDRLVRLWFERLRACEDANEWPEYVQSIVDLDVPEDDGLQLTYAEEAA